VHHVARPAQRQSIDHLQTGFRRQRGEIGGPVSVDRHALGPVATLAQVEPEPGRRKRSDDVGSGATHALEELGRLGHIVEHAEGDGQIVGIHLGQLFPAPLVHVDESGVGRGLLPGHRHHGLGGVDTRDVNALGGQRREEGPTAAADIEDPIGRQRRGDVDGDTQPVEHRPPTEHPRHRLAGVEAGEPSRPLLEVGLEVTVRHGHTPCFRSG
jgi:hypothetical protein